MSTNSQSTSDGKLPTSEHLDTNGDGLGPVRELLEDFDDVEGKVLIPYNDPAGLEPGIRTVVIANKLGNRRLDYTQRRYVDGTSRPRKNEQFATEIRAYVAAYREAKHYIRRIRRKLSTDGRRGPTHGEYGASVVLQRLYSSFFCAHLLYRLGHRYEAHSVSRHILEQIAWAHSAATLTQLADIEKLVTTKTITNLTRFIPFTGRLYGLLSRNVHLDYSGHGAFLSVAEEYGVVRYALPYFREYGEVLLSLADAYGAVYEASQLEFVHEPETIVVRDGNVELNPERPFLRIITAQLAALDMAAT
jgi:hypothetical protein